jgi:hypothetical protein
MKEETLALINTYSYVATSVATIIIAIATIALVYVTFILAKNADKIHKDLTIAELQFYNSITKVEGLLRCLPNGSVNSHAIHSDKQEAMMISSFIDKQKVFYNSTEDEEMKLRMKMSFINFMDRNAQTFIKEKDDTRYAYYSDQAVNKKLKDFLIFIAVR